MKKRSGWLTGAEVMFAVISGPLVRQRPERTSLPANEHSPRSPFGEDPGTPRPSARLELVGVEELVQHLDRDRPLAHRRWRRASPSRGARRRQRRRPGMLVSSSSGPRSSGQVASAPRSVPVSTKPGSSTRDLGREPVGVRPRTDHEEQAVGGDGLLAPARRGPGARGARGVRRHRRRPPRSRRGRRASVSPPPGARGTATCPAASESARTTSVTRFAYRARCSAACPAEFAPPTT